jgi:hypothetical protein
MNECWYGEASLEEAEVPFMEMKIRDILRKIRMTESMG